MCGDSDAASNSLDAIAGPYSPAARSSALATSSTVSKHCELHSPENLSTSHSDAVLAPSTACTATPSRLSPGKTCWRARIQRVSRPVQISAAASRNARHAYAVVRTRRRNARSSRSDSSNRFSVPTHSSSSLRTHSSFIQESPPPVDAVNGSRARIALSTMVAASTTISSVHSVAAKNLALASAMRQTEAAAASFFAAAASASSLAAAAAFLDVGSSSFTAASATLAAAAASSASSPSAASAAFASSLAFASFARAADFLPVTSAAAATAAAAAASADAALIAALHANAHQSQLATSGLAP
mmetsp:Transcript_34605/g.114624  ORF Transcript_34605/g.114624 Transcript_34605/m.114624 type:complete len:301 (-) Transcript_34605:113-1015(-)